MAEPNNNPAPSPGPNPTPEPSPEPSPAPEKTFTQAELDEAIAAAKAEWKSGLKQQLEDAKSEGEKLAKMTAAERKAEEERIEREKFAKEKAAFERKSMVAEVKSQLADKGLPPSFAEMIAGENAEASKANIEAFETAWNSAVEAAVKTRLGGRTPRVGEPSPVGGSGDFYSIMRENQRH